MAYNITKTDGTSLVTVSDGLSDQTTTSLTLIGKNFSGYGEFLNENLIGLLENFANSTEPRSPQTGQLWWDSSTGSLKVKSPGGWKRFSAATPGSTAPVVASTGDIWWDTVNGQLKVYNGSGYTLVGPAFSQVAGTSGAIVETVVDSSANNHIVVKIYTSGKVVATVSQDAEFTPNPPIIGFTSIKPGLTLASTGSVPNARYYGVAEDSDKLGAVVASNYARTDVAETFTDTVAITADGGLTVGSSGSFVQSVSSGSVNLTNRTLNANVSINANVAGTSTTLIQVVGSTGSVNINGTATTRAILPDTNNTRNIGSTSNKFANIYANYLIGTSIQAQYADLAERFAADQAYPAGTVVALGGAAEITAAAEDLTEDVFGVVSTAAAYLMNAAAGSDETHPAIAVNGRVPVRVTGRINKGDRLVAAGNGLARAGSRTEISSFNVIGRALENKTTDGEGTILAIVKLNS